MTDADRAAHGRTGTEHRTWFRDELMRLEEQVMGGLDLVVSQLSAGRRRGLGWRPDGGRA